MRSQPIPLYYQIKEEIINQIESEEILVDQPIPTEKAIMKKYAVSRTTARRAVDALMSEGYVYIVRGKGTYVKEHTMPQGILNCSSCTEMLHSMGYVPVVKLIKSEIAEAKHSIIEKLNLKDGEFVFNIRRVNYINDTPINYTNSYVNVQYCKGIQNYDFTNLSLYTTLQKNYGIKIVAAKQTVEAVLPTIEIAEILKIESTKPILKFNAIVYGMQNGKKIAIETYKTYFRSDRAKFEINHSVE